MSILVITCVTLSSGKSFECRLKVGLSTDDVTIGDIGRYFWPHAFIPAACSSAQIYDQELEDFVNVLNPEEFIVRPKNKVRIDFVHSNDVSVIQPPLSYSFCGTSAGKAFVISQSMGSANTGAPVDTSSVTKIKMEQAEAKTPRFDCNKVKEEVPVCYELQEDLSPDPTPTTSKKPSLISPVVREQVERSPEPVASPAGNSSSVNCLDHNQDIVDAENQIQQPENRKRRHSNSSASPAPKMPLARSNRSPSLNLTTTNESEKVSENVSQKVVPVTDKMKVCTSPEKPKSESESIPAKKDKGVPEQPSKHSSPSTACLDHNQNISDAENQIQQPKNRKRRHSNSSASPPPKTPLAQSNHNPLHDLAAPIEPDQASEEVDEVKQELSSAPEVKANNHEVLHLFPDPNSDIRNPTRSPGRNYSHLKFPKLFAELKKYALGLGMHYEVFHSRIRFFKQNPDSGLIKMMSVVIANWLNCYAPEHSLNFRRAFIRDFLFKMFSKLNFDTSEFTNMNGTGAVDLLVNSPTVFTTTVPPVPDVIEEMRKSDHQTGGMETNHFLKTAAYRDALMDSITKDELEVDVLFDWFPYLLKRTDLLERAIRNEMTFAVNAQFIAKWNTKFSARIEELFNDSKIAVPDDLYPSGMCDRNSLMQFVHLFAITKQKCLPIQLIRDLIIIAKATDEETIHWIRTERAIAHPVILANKNGYRLFVGDRSIFRRTALFSHVLAHLVVVSAYLNIYAVDWFCPLLHVLDRIYGIKTRNQSSHGHSVFCSIKSGFRKSM